jgi:methyltransferase
MSEGGFLVIFIVVQRLAELMIARRNTARLLVAGGVEFGRAHYPFIVIFHAAWIAALWIYGKDQDVNQIGLVIFVVLQILRAWTIATLGSRWTTRIIVMPGLPRILGGPYRFMHHPNYAIVAIEIAVVPLALGLPVFALAAFLVNAVLLAVRIRAEDAALAGTESDEKWEV